MVTRSLRQALQDYIKEIIVADGVPHVLEVRDIDGRVLMIGETSVPRDEGVSVLFEATDMLILCGGTARYGRFRRVDDPETWVEMPLEPFEVRTHVSAPPIIIRIRADGRRAP